MQMVGGRDRDRTGDPLLAKQVLSQLSYTPTREAVLILKHFPPFRIPIFHKLVITVPELCQINFNWLSAPVPLCQILCQLAFSSRLRAVPVFAELLSSSATSCANIS